MKKLKHSVKPTNLSLVNKPCLIQDAPTETIFIYMAFSYLVQND